MTENPRVDPLLKTLVKLLNVSEDRTADSPNLSTVTLLTSGGVVSGDLIPATVYYRRMAERVDSLKEMLELVASNYDGADALRKAGLDALKDLDQEAADQFSDSFPDPEFAHLDRAAWFGGAGALDCLPSDGTLWRVRLDTVCAWHVGAYNAEFSHRQSR